MKVISSLVVSVACLVAPVVARAQGAPATSAAPEGAVPVVLEPAPAQPVALPSQPPGIPIRIETGGEPVNVAIQTPGGEQPMCTAPCTLNVPPYPVYLVTDGPGYPRTVHPLGASGPTRYLLHRPSPGGIAGGTVMIVAGSIVAAGGLLAAFLGGLSSGGAPLVGVGVAGMVGGAGLIVGGAVIARHNSRTNLQPLGPLLDLAPVAMVLPSGGALLGVGGRF